MQLPRLESFNPVGDGSSRPISAARPERLRKRASYGLMLAQPFAALGASGGSACPLAAFAITRSAALASIPLAFTVAGSAAAATSVSALARTAGRRLALVVALATGAAGAGGCAVANLTHSFALFCIASIAFGAGPAAVLLARYAAADLSGSVHRGRAIGRILFLASAGGVLGPNLLGPTGEAARWLGFPTSSGLYLLAVAAFGAAAVVLFVMFRFDEATVDTAARFAGEALPTVRLAVPLRHLLSHGYVRVGLIMIIGANFVMVAVMTMAPLAMQMHGMSLDVIGMVVSVHVAAMFAPSPLTGWASDRLGRVAIMRIGAITLVAAGVLAAVAGPFLVVGLVLLGLGWNAAVIAGSALLIDEVPAADRTRVEGACDAGMGVSAAAATAICGPVMGVAGYATLGVLGAAVASAVAVGLTLAHRSSLRDASGFNGCSHVL